MERGICLRGPTGARRTFNGVAVSVEGNHFAPPYLNAADGKQPSSGHRASKDRHSDGSFLFVKIKARGGRVEEIPRHFV